MRRKQKEIQLKIDRKKREREGGKEREAKRGRQREGGKEREAKRGEEKRRNEKDIYLMRAEQKEREDN